MTATPSVQTLWSHTHTAAWRGLMQTRERGLTLAWDARHTLFLFNRRGQPQAQWPCPGELVDAAIVVVEQTHKKLESYEASGLPFVYRDVVMEAVREVAGPTFFALLVIAVAFLPVLVLEGQEGKLFRPLVYTKNFAMLAAAVLAITFDPALRLLLVRRPAVVENSGSAWQRLSNWLLGGRIRPQEDHPITGPLMRIYDPVVRWTLRWKWLVIAGAMALVLITLPLFWKIGSEFMPSVEEGSLLYKIGRAHV